MDSSHRALDVTSQLAPHLTPRGELSNLDLIPHIMQPTEVRALEMMLFYTPYPTFSPLYIYISLLSISISLFIYISLPPAVYLFKDCVVPVFSPSEMKVTVDALKEKSKFLNTYLHTLHSNLQLQHHRAASRIPDYKQTPKPKPKVLPSVNQWVTIDSDAEEVNGQEDEVVDEEYEAGGGGEMSESSQDDDDDDDDSDPEDWAVSSRSSRRTRTNNRVLGRTSRHPTRFTSRRSGSSVNYRRGIADSDSGDDSDDLMQNVSFDMEQAKAQRVARLEKRQAQVLQEAGVKQSKKASNAEVAEVCDEFDTDIDVGESSSSSSSLTSSSSSSSSSIQMSTLTCALCGLGHTEQDPLPGKLTGRHPLKIANKRVCVHDNCASFSPEVKVKLSL